MAEHRRIAGETTAALPVPKTREEVLTAIKESDTTREVDIDFELFNEVENFPPAGRYPAKIKFVHEEVFYVVIPPVGDLKSPIPDDALVEEYITMIPRDGSFVDSAEAVDSSFFDDELGHVLEFSNLTMGFRARKSIRVPVSIKMYVSVVEGRKRVLDDVELKSVDLSGTGVAGSCKRGSGIYEGMEVDLRIANRNFPGYNSTIEGALYKALVVRKFPHASKDDWENYGIEFRFEDPFEEVRTVDLISKFCMKLKLSEHQQKVEAELTKKYGGKFKKKIKRF